MTSQRPRGRPALARSATRLATARPTWVTALALLLPLLALLGLVRQYLILAPPGSWQLDLDVYRTAGVSILTGRPVYQALTPPPQLLPFTYPPFAAILAIPLALVPFWLAGWAWFVVQAGAVLATTWYAGSPMWRRCGRLWLPAWAAFTGLALWMIPVKDGFRYGQVDAFLVLAVLLDLLRARPVRRLPLGVCIGLATAIKLTPGVFIVHFLVTRQWRAALTSIGTAAAATLAAFLLLPHASFAFWGGALQDPSRLGRNDGTANQSIRGVLLRLFGLGHASHLLWLLLAAVTVVAGFAIARDAHRRGLRRLELSAVALTGVLISPVSWIHHFAWVLIVIPAVWGPVPWRDRPRMVAGLALLLGFLLDLPWWAQWKLMVPGRQFTQEHRIDPFWTVLNNGYCLIAVLALALVAWAARRSRPTGSATAP